MRRIAKRLGGVTTAALIAGALALAAGNTGNWKLADGGKVIAQKAGDYVIVTNTGQDPVDVKAKGASITKGGQLDPGFRGSMLMPQGSKAVVLKDTNPGNGKGAKGYIVWASKGLGQGGTGSNGDLLTQPIN